jgi:restriction system protein
MTGEEFENYLMRILKQHGCVVSGTPKTGDQGADIIARLDKRVIVIQAKRSISPIGNRAVQEVVAALAYYDGSEGWVVTNSSFTQAARGLADRNGIRLISGAELALVGEFLGGG